MEFTTVLLASVPKDGRDRGDNDDKVRAGQDRFALADGASTTARPELWAELLVDAFLERGSEIWQPDVLDDLRSRWLGQATQPGLPWYAEAKLREGGAATLVCLSLNREQGRYHVRGVGDSCLFHVRDYQLVFVEPIRSPQLFNNYPGLISTRIGDRSFQDQIWLHDARCQEGDFLVLASDALAKTVLGVEDSGFSALWNTLLDCLQQDRFNAWVNERRQSGQLDNDDTSICVVPL